MQEVCSFLYYSKYRPPPNAHKKTKHNISSHIYTLFHKNQYIFYTVDYIIYFFSNLFK